LYSSREGRTRLISFLEELLRDARTGHGEVQLLFFEDGDALDRSGQPAVRTWASFREEGLTSLQLGVVTSLRL
jgi:hypothetical protein